MTELMQEISDWIKQERPHQLELMNKVDMYKYYQRSRHFKRHGIRVYLRYQLDHHRLVDFKNVITVADVNVELKNKGTYSNFLLGLESLENVNSIFIENILDETQAPLYFRRGYEEYKYDSSQLCVFKRLIK
jgi:hypothetical protein